MKRALFLILFYLYFFPLTSFAEDDFSMTIVSQEDLVRAYGILFFSSESNARQESSSSSVKVDLRRKEGATWKLTPDLSDFPSVVGGRITVIAKTVSGKVIAGPVKVLGSNKKQAVNTDSSCKLLEDIAEIKKLITFDKEKLENLIHIRNQRVELLDIQLRKLLSSEASRVLSAIEKEHGIIKDLPITSDMPLDELAKRLSSIAAIKH